MAANSAAAGVLAGAVLAVGELFAEEWVSDQHSDSRGSKGLVVVLEDMKVGELVVAAAGPGMAGFEGSVQAAMGEKEVFVGVVRGCTFLETRFAAVAMAEMQSFAFAGLAEVEHRRSRN